MAVSSRIERIIRSSEKNYHLSRSSRELIQRYLEKTAKEIVKKIEQTAEQNDYNFKTIHIMITRDTCEKFLVSPFDEYPPEDIKLLKEENYEIGELKHETENVEVA
jgi:hypothetical protein